MPWNVHPQLQGIIGPALMAIGIVFVLYLYDRKRR
jgi:hypothetical protein